MDYDLITDQIRISLCTVQITQTSIIPYTSGSCLRGTRFLGLHLARATSISLDFYGFPPPFWLCSKSNECKTTHLIAPNSRNKSERRREGWDSF